MWGYLYCGILTLFVGLNTYVTFYLFDLLAEQKRVADSHHAALMTMLPTIEQLIRRATAND